MTGLEYMRTVCPTTSVGKDPNREDVQDAFEDGVAEGYKRAMTELKAKIDLVKKNGSWKGVDMDVFRREMYSDIAERPKWKHPEEKYQYPESLTRVMDEFGDWHYAFSEGHLNPECEYIPLAILGMLPDDVK